MIQSFISLLTLQSMKTGLTCRLATPSMAIPLLLALVRLIFCFLLNQILIFLTKLSMITIFVVPVLRRQPKNEECFTIFPHTSGPSALYCLSAKAQCPNTSLSKHTSPGLSKFCASPSTTCGACHMTFLYCQTTPWPF